MTPETMHALDALAAPVVLAFLVALNVVCAALVLIGERAAAAAVDMNEYDKGGDE